MLVFRAALAEVVQGRIVPCVDVSRSRRLGLHRHEHKRFAQFILSSLTESQSHNYNGVRAFFAALYSFSALRAHSRALAGRCPRAGALSHSSTALQRGEASGGGFPSPLHLSSHRFAL